MRLLIVAILTIAVCEAKTVVVKASKMKFNPSVVKISQGDTVEFVNEDNMIHNVVGSKKEFRSPFLKKGDKFSHKFESKGVVEYHCEPHKAMGMKGKVEIE